MKHKTTGTLKGMQTTVRQQTALDQAMLAVDEVLETFFETQIQAASELDPSYLRLWESLRMVKNAGGKRMRPYMVLLACHAFKGRLTDQVIAVAAAQELLHISLLIHDDIMDGSEMRHGEKNITGIYHDIYSEHATSFATAMHHAEGAAILGGDLLLAAAQDLLSSSLRGLPEAQAAQALFYDAIFTVAGGQLLDMESSIYPIAKVDPLKIARYKTAGYGFITPLCIGGLLAGASADKMHILRSFGEQLGIAFQLKDDLLGVFGNEHTTGKPTDRDLIEGVKTLLIQEFLQHASPEQKQVFASTFGQADATPEAIEALRQAITKSGAKKIVEDKITASYQAITAQLQDLQLDDFHQKLFMGLVDKALKREY